MNIFLITKVQEYCNDFSKIEHFESIKGQIIFEVFFKLIGAKGLKLEKVLGQFLFKMHLYIFVFAIF